MAAFSTFLDDTLLTAAWSAANQVAPGGVAVGRRRRPAHTDRRARIRACVCIYICMYVCMYAYLFVSVLIYVFTCLSISVNVYLSFFVYWLDGDVLYLCIRTCILCICMHVYVYVYVYAEVWIGVGVGVYAYIYT